MAEKVLSRRKIPLLFPPSPKIACLSSSKVEISFIAPCEIWCYQKIMWSGSYHGSLSTTYSSPGVRINRCSGLLEAVFSTPLLLLSISRKRKWTIHQSRMFCLFALQCKRKKGKEVLIFALYCTPPEGVSKSAVCLAGNWTTLHLVSLPLCGEGLSIRYKSGYYVGFRKSESLKLLLLVGEMGDRWYFFFLRLNLCLFLIFPGGIYCIFPVFFVTFISSQFDNCQLSAWLALENVEKAKFFFANVTYRKKEEHERKKHWRSGNKAKNNSASSLM